MRIADCQGCSGGTRSYGDLYTDLGIPDVSQEGLLAAPAIALYALGAALIVGAVIFARKKKR